MTARTLAAASFALTLSAGAALAQTPGDPPEFASVDLVAQQQPPAPPVVQPPPQGGPRRPDQPNQPRPIAQPPQPPSPPQVGVVVPPREGQSFNIKVDVTISEQIGTSAPVRKTVSVVSGDNMPGFVRSEATFSGGTPAPLNVDIEPRVLPDGKIRLGLSVRYDLPAPPNIATDSAGRLVESQPPVRSALGNLTRTEVRQNLKVVLENGKPLMISQSADPISDRQVTIEVKATILK